MARGTHEEHNPSRRPARPATRIGFFTNIVKPQTYNSRTAPFADSQGRAITDPYARVNAAAEAFQSQQRVAGTMKHFGFTGPEGFSKSEYEGSRPLMRSIDEVGFQYAPTVYDVENDMTHELQTGYWTKRGAKKKSKEMLNSDIEMYAIKEGEDTPLASTEPVERKNTRRR
jgi:hypothetical protein